MAYWITRDDDKRASYDVWSRRPTWYENWGFWDVLYKNGKTDIRQPIDSYNATSFPAVSGLHLKPGELVKIVSFDIKVERVGREKKNR